MNSQLEGGDETIDSAVRPGSVRLVDIRIVLHGFDMDLTWICGGGTVDAFCDAHHALDVSSTPLTQLGRFPDAKQRL